MKRSYYLLYIIIFITTSLFAQEVEKKEQKSNTKYSAKNIGSTQAVEGDVIFSDGINPLLRITDEGDFGAVELSNGVPDVKINKLYNNNGTLYFEDTALGSGSGASQLNDLQDAKFDGESLFIGEESGIVDDGGNSDGINNFNTSLGAKSLKLNVIGSYNVAVGNSALFINSIGHRNVSIGYQTLFTNNSGSDNTVLGTNAMYNNFAGNKNSVNGSEAMYSNLQGSQNSAFGYQSMYNNFFGNSNIGIGAYTNYFNKDGNNNTIIGFEAGKGTTDHSKSGNIFLGYQAGFNEVGNNKLYIENSNSSQPLIYGDFENDSIKINGNLNVSGNITFLGDKNIPQTIGDLVDSKSSSNSLFLGMNAGSSETTSNDNLGIGINSALNNVNGKYNITIGNSSNYENIDGSYNTIIGYEAGRGNSPSSKSGNVLIGYKAGYYETENNRLYINNDSSNSPLIWGDFTDGSEKVKINGNFHVSGNITAGGSVEGPTRLNDLSDAKYDGESLFIGEGAGTNDDAGASDGSENYNLGVGKNALATNISGSRNSALGSESLPNNITGSRNTTVGHTSMFSNTSGNANVALGFQSNYFNETGEKNTLLGTRAGYGSASNSFSGNVFIGYQAGYNEISSDKLYIENSDSDAPLIWGDFTEGSERVVINGNGTNGNSNYQFFVNGEAGGIDSWNNLSDIRLKKDIKTISNPLEKVQNLRGVNFTWKNSNLEQDENKMGFIAQEVNDVLPELVDTDGEFYSMQYAPITALLVEAVKKQQLLIKELTLRIEELENKK